MYWIRIAWTPNHKRAVHFGFHGFLLAPMWIMQYVSSSSGEGRLLFPEDVTWAKRIGWSHTYHVTSTAVKVPGHFGRGANRKH